VTSNPEKSDALVHCSVENINAAVLCENHRERVTQIWWIFCHHFWGTDTEVVSRARPFFPMLVGVAGISATPTNTGKKGLARVAGIPATPTNTGKKGLAHETNTEGNIWWRRGNQHSCW